MKSLSVRPFSTTLRQNEAHCAASRQAVGIVSDCAVGNPESEPIAIDIAAADAASHWRNLILRCPSGRPADCGSHATFWLKCDRKDDYPMNGAGESANSAGPQARP